MERNNDEGETTNEQKDACGECNTPLVQIHITGATADATEQGEQQEAPKPNGPPKTSYAIKWFTGALVVVGAISAYIAYLQWRTSEDVAQLTRDTNRAYVYFDRVSVQRDTTGEKPVIGINITVTNSGNTPAQNARLLLDCPPATPDFKSDPFVLFKWDDAKAEPVFLGPQQHITQLVCIIPEDKLDEIRSQKSKRFIIGEIRYMASIEPTVPRVTQISRRIFFGPGGQYSTQNLGKHNCSDHKCSRP